MITLADIVIIGTISLATSALAYLAMRRAPSATTAAVNSTETCAVFLFDGEVLIDTNQEGEVFLTSFGVTNRNWTTVYQVLSLRFPTMPIHQPDTPVLLPMILESQDAGSTSRLYIEQAGERIRLRLKETPIAPRSVTDLYRQRGWEGQLSRLRNAVNNAPYPIWQTTTNGRILWANTAYQNLMEACDQNITQDAQGVHYPDLFQLPGRGCLQRDRYRACVALAPGQETLWYEINAVRSELHTMHYATDINAIVQSEKTQREFVQTLTKTFAQLSIGLAVFDRKRELTLFNPALTDLTGLAPAFLASKPSLRSLFDALRDAQMMPEPRDYQSWHENLDALTDAALDGRYTETWNLPTGQMYRISGRPHPDGAIVFLFEDISAEMSLNRRFRADMQLNQSVLDQYTHPIAVFSANGSLHLKNAAYDAQWPITDDIRDGAIQIDQRPEQITDLMHNISRWQKHDANGIDWHALTAQVAEIGPEVLSGCHVTLDDGTPRSIWVRKLPDGATLICFGINGSHAQLVKSA